MSSSWPGTDVCPRCGNAFQCGARDAAPCACIHIPLDSGALARLRQRYQGCLCLACLMQFAARGTAVVDDDRRAPPGAA